MKLKTSVKPRGRPRAFDIDEALGKALRVFSRHGYEGASLPDLTRAMGINRPSLYAAFGNKEALFRKVVDRYADQSECFVRTALEAPTARGAVENLLRGIIGKPGARKTRGCLLVQGALACGESAEPIRKELALRRSSVEFALRKRFERALSEKDLPADINPAVLAKLVATFQQGMAVQMAGGARHQDLLAAVELAIRGWPLRVAAKT